MFEHMYDDVENTQVRFAGFASDKARYDFAIVFTSKFFGKPLVICMQTGRSSVVCSEDSKDIENIMKKFALTDREEAQELSYFFQTALPSLTVGEPQYS